MKKTYISPELLTVALSPRAGILKDTSLPIGSGETPIENPNEILTKENKNVNVWDEEW